MALRRSHVLAMWRLRLSLAIAFVLTALVLYQGAEVPSYDDAAPVVGVVTPGSPAAAADIRSGDRMGVSPDGPSGCYRKRETTLLPPGVKSILLPTWARCSRGTQIGGRDVTRRTSR